MKDPVEDGRVDYRVPEDLVPLAEASIRSEYKGAFFVAAGDELEEEVRNVPVDRDVADFVDDQELGLGVKLQPLFDPVLGVGLGQRGRSEAWPG